MDYLPDEMAYSIDTLPTDPVYKEYVDGGKIYQLEYAFTSKEPCDGNTLTMLGNTQFYQQLSSWVEEQDDAEELPELLGYHAISNRVISSGYLYDADADLGKYQIQMRLLYQ